MPSVVKPLIKLSDLHKRFCLEYTKDLNGKAAAIRAGYGEKGAASQACGLLQDPLIIQACQKLMDKRAERVRIDADQVLIELIKLGRSDVRKVFQENGALKDVKDFPDDMAVAISSVEVDETFEGYGEDRKWTGYTKKIKFWDKPKALELIGKHLKMFTDVHELGPKVEREFQDMSNEELDDILKGVGDDTRPNS